MKDSDITKAEEIAGHPLRAIEVDGKVAKQVIVLRNKYPNANGELQKIRTGKLVSQGAHASLLGYKSASNDYNCEINFDNPPILSDNSQAFEAWDEGAFTKITVYVETEEELVEVYENALKANLIAVMITDSGKTEFNGVPTKTAVAIGPAWDSLLKPITGSLKLL